MKQSSNLGLALYDKTDLMNITGLENSLNHNMELIDSEINQLLKNKADSNHSHAAENITSGTLAVARGGTGKSSVTSGNFLVGNGTGAMTEKTPAQVLSAIGAAASGHNHDDKYYTET